MVFSVEAPGGFSRDAVAFVEVEFATAHHVVAPVAKQAIECGRLKGHVLTVALNRAVVVFHAQGKGRAARRTQRRGCDGVRKSGTRLPKPIQVGGANGNLRIAGDPVKPQLIGKEEEDVGLLGHGLSLW